jgi:hypothetical protein
VSGLEIPTEAITAAARAAYVDLEIHTSAPIEAALAAAAPIIVAAELRALLALHPGGSLNYWVSRRADELEHPAVNL